MVEAHVRARGVRDAKVLSAMGAVPREKFVPAEYRHLAYDDAPLPIGEGQTISQPYIVAFMVEALALTGGEKALEIGAGSGYAAAVLAQICGEVYAVERIEQLSATSADTLRKIGVENVHVRFADGSAGWADHAPYDAILVSAGAPSISETLKRQLAIGGRMVVPVGDDPRAQELVRVTRVSEGEFVREYIADVRFVPLIGKEGWELDESDVADGVWRGRPRSVQSRSVTNENLPGLVSSHAEPFERLRSTPVR